MKAAVLLAVVLSGLAFALSGRPEPKPTEVVCPDLAEFAREETDDTYPVLVANCGGFRVVILQD